MYGLTLQSNVVTSLTDEVGEECLRTTELREASVAARRPDGPSGTRQIRAVSSPELRIIINIALYNIK